MILQSLVVVFILVNQCLAKGVDEMFDHSELVGGSWRWAYQALCFSCGYFAYDQWDMLQYRLYSGLIPSILVHHLVLLVCFTLALYRNVTINYLILTLICEMHSIFLHVRKLRRMAGIRDSNTALVKLEWVLNWTAFLFARCVPHILITVKLIKDAHKFGRGLEWPLALFGMAGMNILNVGLGMDLFHAFRRERSNRRNQEKSNHVEWFSQFRKPSSTESKVYCCNTHYTLFCFSFYEALLLCPISFQIFACTIRKNYM